MGREGGEGGREREGVTMIGYVECGSWDCGWGRGLVDDGAGGCN